MKPEQFESMAKHKDFETIRKLNPQLFKTQSFKPTPVAQSNEHENKFYRIWTDIGGPELEREYQFHPTRRWRFDFAHVKTKTAIEINGQVWSKGGHSSGSGLIRDYKKTISANLLGWHLYPISTCMLNDSVDEFIRPILSRLLELDKVS